MAGAVQVVAAGRGGSGDWPIQSGLSSSNLLDFALSVDVISMEQRCLSKWWLQTARAGPVNLILASGQVCILGLPEDK